MDKIKGQLDVKHEKIEPWSDYEQYNFSTRHRQLP